MAQKVLALSAADQIRSYRARIDEVDQLDEIWLATPLKKMWDKVVEFRHTVEEIREIIQIAAKLTEDRNQILSQIAIGQAPVQSVESAFSRAVAKAMPKINKNLAQFVGGKSGGVAMGVAVIVAYITEAMTRLYKGSAVAQAVVDVEAGLLASDWLGWAFLKMAAAFKLSADMIAIGTAILHGITLALSFLSGLLFIAAICVALSWVVDIGLKLNFGLDADTQSILNAPGILATLAGMVQAVVERNGEIALKQSEKAELQQQIKQIDQDIKDLQSSGRF